MSIVQIHYVFRKNYVVKLWTSKEYGNTAA